MKFGSFFCCDSKVKRLSGKTYKRLKENRSMGVNPMEQTNTNFKEQWNTQIETLNRLKWNLPMEHHEELEEKMDELKELVEKADEQREREGLNNE